MEHTGHMDLGRAHKSGPAPVNARCSARAQAPLMFGLLTLKETAPRAVIGVTVHMRCPRPGPERNCSSRGRRRAVTGGGR